MGDWFMGEIRLFAFDYVPTDGWLSCNGQILQIAQNQALYSLVGIAFGGDGQKTFALPDLRGRVAVNPWAPSRQPGITISRGDYKGAETNTLAVTTVPSHTHQVQAISQNGTTNISRGNLWAAVEGGQAIYGVYPEKSPGVINITAVNGTGGGGPHNNMQPFQVLNYCIAGQGIYPPRK